MSMTTDRVAELAPMLKGDDPTGMWELGVIESVDFRTYGDDGERKSPTLDVRVSADDTRPMAFVGEVGEYNTGQTVMWVDKPGSPIVIGPVPIKGADPADPSSLEPYHEVGAAGEPAFQSGWGNFGSGHATAGFYRQNDGWVRLKGLVSGGTSTSVIFTLPEGYRPPFDCYLTVLSNAAAAQITITTAGTVTKVAGGSNNHVSLNGLTFPSHWNAAAWDVIPLLGNWSFNPLLSGSVPETFIRDDGWCYVKGALATQTSPNTLAPGSWGRVPQSALTRAGAVMMLGYEGSGFGVGARMDVKIYGEIAYIPASAQASVVGGMHWFSARSDSIVSWTAPGLTNGWSTPPVSNFRPFNPGYYKDHFGVVHLRGLIDGSGRTTGDMFTLPVGYRPAERQAFVTVGANDGIARIDVLDTGVVNWPSVGSAAGTMSLNGISFRAEQ